MFMFSIKKKTKDKHKKQHEDGSAQPHARDGGAQRIAAYCTPGHEDCRFLVEIKCWDIE
jgi:hypothetical protein